MGVQKWSALPIVLSKAAFLKLAGVSAFILFMGVAHAAEFKSVKDTAVLFDAPSASGQKRFFIKQYTPVEVVVRLKGWVKVRSVVSGLFWLEDAFLSDTRTVMVTAPMAEVRSEPSDSSSLLFKVDSQVALEYLDRAPGGWIHVRHRDGQSGYVRVTQVWGGA